MIRFTKSAVIKPLVGVGIFIIYYFAANAVFGFVCPSMILVGLPCPACGLTRAGVLFFTGNFGASFEMHPMLLPALAWGGIAVVCKLRWPHKYEHVNTLAIVLLVCILVVFVVRMIFLFPHTPPLDINENSVLHRIIYPFRR